MGKIDSPFDSINSVLDELTNVPIFIDFHVGQPAGLVGPTQPNPVNGLPRPLV